MTDFLSVNTGGLSRRYLDVWGVTDNTQPYFDMSSWITLWGNVKLHDDLTFAVDTFLILGKHSLSAATDLVLLLNRPSFLDHRLRANNRLSCHMVTWSLFSHMTKRNSVDSSYHLILTNKRLLTFVVKILDLRL
jgi:hypothetical protein